MTDSDPGHEATYDGDGVRHSLKIVVPAVTMEQHVDRAARALRSRARLAGFRKGKAPLSMVRQQFAEDIRERVLEYAISEHLSRELEGRGLQPIDSPALEEVDFEPGSPLRFSVRFDTAPEVELRTLDGLHATRPSTAVTDEMVDEAVAELRERAAELVPADEDEAAVPGHYVRCAISLFPRDGKGKRLAEENRFVRVGDEAAIPGLNAQLEGLSVGDEREFVTRLSDEFPNAILAGKDVQCRVKVEEIKRRDLPAIDDELAKELGFEDLAALRAGARADLEGQAARRGDREVEAQLLHQLRDGNPVTVPDSLVERRLDDLVRKVATDIARQGVDPREALDWSSFRAENRASAEHSIAEEMLLDRIAEQEGLEADDAAVQVEIRRRVQAEPAGNRRSLAAIVQQMRKDGSFEQLRRSLRRRSALDRLKQRATIEHEGGEHQGAAGAPSGE